MKIFLLISMDREGHVRRLHPQIHHLAVIFSVIMLFWRTGVALSHASFGMAGIWVLLATMGLFSLSISAAFEAFLLALGGSLVVISCYALHPLLALCYGGYVILPLLMMSIYRRYTGVRDQHKRDLPALSFFHGLEIFFSFFTFALSLLWLDCFSFFAVPPSFWLLWLPGGMALFGGALWVTLMMVWAPRVGYPLESHRSFQTTVFDYWSVVFYQVAFLMGSKVIFGNMLLVSLLPFFIQGVKRLEKRFNTKPWWVSTPLSFAAIFSAIPLVGVILYTLFEPWIERKDYHGHC